MDGGYLVCATPPSVYWHCYINKNTGGGHKFFEFACYTLVILFITKYENENHLMIDLSYTMLNEPPREKTNNVVSDQVRHKPTCTVTEAG